MKRRGDIHAGCSTSNYVYFAREIEKSVRVERHIQNKGLRSDSVDDSSLSRSVGLGLGFIMVSKQKAWN